MFIQEVVTSHFMLPNTYISQQQDEQWLKLLNESFFLSHQTLAVSSYALVSALNYAVIIQVKNGH